jgi:DNA replication protein DnaC
MRKVISMHEKRYAPRLNIYLASSLKEESDPQRAFSIVRNISGTGMFLTSKKQYEKGSVAECVVSVDDTPISFKGEVVRTENCDAYFGHGIKITEIDEDSRRELNDFLERNILPPMVEMDCEFGTDFSHQENVLNLNSHDIDIDGIHLNYIYSDGKASRLKQANFPFVSALEDFDMESQGAEFKNQLDEILTFDWVKKSNHILLFGTSDLVKTKLAVGIGMKAIDAGYKVVYTSMSDLVELFNTERTSLESKFTLNKILNSNVVVIDKAGTTPLALANANAFFQFVSALHGKASIVMASEAPFDQWKCDLGDMATTNLILERMEYNLFLKGLLN